MCFYFGLRRVHSTVLLFNFFSFSAFKCELFKTTAIYVSRAQCTWPSSSLLNWCNIRDGSYLFRQLYFNLILTAAIKHSTLAPFECWTTWKVFCFAISPACGLPRDIPETSGWPWWETGWWIRGSYILMIFYKLSEAPMFRGSPPLLVETAKEHCFIHVLLVASDWLL